MVLLVLRALLRHPIFHPETHYHRPGSASIPSGRWHRRTRYRCVRTIRRCRPRLSHGCNATASRCGNSRAAHTHRQRVDIQRHRALAAPTPGHLRSHSPRILFALAPSPRQHIHVLESNRQTRKLTASTSRIPPAAGSLDARGESFCGPLPRGWVIVACGFRRQPLLCPALDAGIRRHRHRVLLDPIRQDFPSSPRCAF